MPKPYRELDTSPFLDLDPTQQKVFDNFLTSLDQCNAADSYQWTCFAWKLDPRTHRRIYPGRDEIVCILDTAVLWLRARGYWWPMIAIVVKSPLDPSKGRKGRWHVHILEIAGRLPTRHERELIHEALRSAGFSDVRLDDLTLGRSQLAWWRPRKVARAHGHEGFRRYGAKNVAEHDSDTPFAVYRTSNVPGPALPGEEVTREILRAARSSAPKAPAPSPRRPVARAPDGRSPPRSADCRASMG